MAAIPSIYDDGKDKPAFEVEQSIDAFGTYETRWACTAPPMGSLFKVTTEEWLDGDTVRVIWAYDLVATPES